MAETNIPWLENAALGLESCIPMSLAEEFSLKDGSQSTSISNAICYLDWLIFLAPRIDSFINEYQIKGNAERERVIARFVSWCKRFGDLSQLSSSRHSQLRSAYIRASRLIN